MKRAKRIANILKKFAADMELRDFAPTTCKSYLQKATAFSNYLELKRLEIVKADQEVILSYLGYLRAKGLRRKSIEANFNAITSLYDFFIERERLISINPARLVSKRYLKTYKDHQQRRQLISIEDASRLVQSILPTRNKAIVTVLFKTGIRLNELISLDISDIDFANGSIRLKEAHKRSNTLVFFDDETKVVLERWIKARKTRQVNEADADALFITNRRRRIEISTIEKFLEKYAENVGLHDPHSKDIGKRFTPHCCRHWFTTHLREAGMPREYIQYLRGDKPNAAIDDYLHITPKKVKESYLVYIPRL
jgi:integrase/recombinase XerD